MVRKWLWKVWSRIFSPSRRVKVFARAAECDSGDYYYYIGGICNFYWESVHGPNWMSTG